MTEFKLFSPVKPAKNYIQIFNFLQNKIFIVSAYGTERIISILGKTTLRNIYRHAFRYTICSIEFMDIWYRTPLRFKEFCASPNYYKLYPTGMV